MLSIQNEIKVKPGHVLDPIAPLFFGQPGDHPLVESLCFEVERVDSYGSKFDFEDNLDWVIDQIESQSYGWYKAALWLWKVKILKAWESHPVRDLGTGIADQSRPAHLIFSSFREFCEKAIGRTTACVNSWIRAARTISLLIAQGFTRLPKSISIALELGKNDDAIVCDVWRDLCDRYQDHEITVEKMNHLNDEALNVPQYKNVRLGIDYFEKLREKAAEGHLSPKKFLEQILEDYFGNDQDDRAVSDGIEGTGQGSGLEARDSQCQIEPPDDLSLENRGKPSIDHHDPVSPQGHGDGDFPQGDPRPSAKKSGFLSEIARIDTKSPTLPDSKSGRKADAHSAPNNTGLYFVSTKSADEERAANTLKQKLQEYRENPRVHRRCQTCGSSHQLTACFNLGNKSKVADRYYCKDHLEDSGYCQCGRWPTQCNCKEVELEF